MKYSVTIFTVFLFYCLSSSLVFAQTSPMQKIKRGALNIVSSPIELPKQVRAYWITGSEKTPHILAWLFCGAVKGVVNMVSRVGSGVWDIAAAGVDLPRGGQALMQPVNVFDEWPKRTRPAKPMIE